MHTHTCVCARSQMHEDMGEQLQVFFPNIKCMQGFFLFVLRLDMQVFYQNFKSDYLRMCTFVHLLSCILKFFASIVCLYHVYTVMRNFLL